ncbi:MAG: hypothetical protein Q9181_004366 [Wetmoreana brouardii]
MRLGSITNVILANFLSQRVTTQSASSAASGSGAPYEQIQATNLLGSHFGVPGIPGSYDYVIVGGGTAGLTLARRLAADTSITVAVIEAGGLYELDNGNLSQIPADATYWVDGSTQTRNPLVDWYQFTEPQPVNPSLVHVSQGCSSRYSRGLEAEAFIIQWEEPLEVGVLGTCYGIKGSTCHDPLPDGASKHNLLHTVSRGSTGSYQKWADHVADPSYSFKQFLAYFEKGVQFNPPSADRPANATSKYDTTTLSKSGGPLKVYKSTLAKRILFGDSKQAAGVQVTSGGFEYQIKANKEVIVSAGAFRSPQLLMVSGIGPQATLREQGIPVLSDRPEVGQNMFDHVSLGSVYAANLVTHSQLITDPKFLAAAAQESDLDVAFGQDWPDIELLFLDGNFISASTDSRNYVSSVAGLVAPFSRGNVTIKSIDTNDNPIVSPNWLLDVRDQEVAIAGFKRARQVFQTRTIQPIINGAEAFPGLNVTSDEDILAVIKQSAASIDHAACTCAMGKPTDPMAVLDSRARVIGVKGLRVVDASAFPFLPPGHPQGTVYALAEKIADDILRTI